MKLMLEIIENRLLAVGVNGNDIPAATSGNENGAKAAALRQQEKKRR
jgi:hypothetical protein